MNIMKSVSLKQYERPETRELELRFETTILSGNMEDPVDPGTEIDF